MLQLFLHQPPGRIGQKFGDGFGRGMRAVRGGKSVVDVKIAELGQRGGEGHVVGFLALVEAQILQHQHVTVFQRRDRFLGRGPDAVLGEGDRAAAQRFAQRRRDGTQRQRRVTSLGPAEMRHHDDARALLRQLAQGRRQTVEARRVGHLAVGHGHVQIGAHDDAAAANG